MYQANSTWLKLIRKHLSKTLLDGLTEAFKTSKPLSFLSHPVPECSCLKNDHFESINHASSPSNHIQLNITLGVQYRCPSWMDNNKISQSPKYKEYEEDQLDEEDPSSGLFFRQNSGNTEAEGEETNNKEVQLEDQEELEGVER